MVEPRREKMSKSRGNAISVDEMVYGVFEMDSNYEFRYADGEVIENFHAVGVWRDRPNTSFYFTASRFGKRPVFLCQKGDPGACILLIDGKEVEQHPDGETRYFVYQYEEEE